MIGTATEWRETDTMSNNTKGPGWQKLGWRIVLPILLLQFYSRFVPSPRAEFIADDWSNYARSTFYTSSAQAAWTGLQDPNRPISMMAVELAYRGFRARPVYWTVLSVAAHSFLLWCVMHVGFELTGRRRVAALQGALFALLPNIPETWHWSTQIVNETTCALMFYAWSAWLFLSHLRRGGILRLVFSVLTYAVALFSYEQGILLPAAYGVLLLWRPGRWREGLRMAPFAGVVLFYAAWRLTNAFGLNESWSYPPHMNVEGFSLWVVGWNVRQVLHWWIGDRFFGAILAGLTGFATLGLQLRRWLIVGNLVAVGLAAGWWGRSSRQKDEVDPEAFTSAQAVLFGVVWIGASVATSLVSYTAGRLNVLPAMGVTLLGGMILAHLPWRTWAAVLFVPAVICLVANQGTTENFRQVGEFNRRLYNYLSLRQADWQEKDILYVDTMSLRHRLTRGLLSIEARTDEVWAEYGNVPFLRGFVPGGMVRLLTRQPQPRIRIVHDMECGGRLESDALYWHTRYNPEKPHRTPRNQVFVVDVWEAAVQAR